MVAIPPDRLQSLLKSGDGDADNAASGAATPPEQTPGPAGAPMSTPEPKMGNREGALVHLSMALDLIQQAIPDLGLDSEEGRKAMNVTKMLNGILGPSKPRADALQPAEILQLLGSLPQAGNVTPEVAAAIGPGASAQPKPVAPMLPTGGQGAPQPTPQPQAA